MQLNNKEYNNVLSAVEELASKQMNLDIDIYRKEVLQVFHQVLGYSMSLFWIADQNKGLINPIVFNIDEGTLKEYLHYYQKYDFLQPCNLIQKKRVQRIDDVIPFSKYLESEYYHSFMKKNKILDEMAIYLEYQGEFVGVIGLVRHFEEERFTTTDSMKLNFLVKQIESGFNLQRIFAKNKNWNNTVLTDREQELIHYLEKGLKNKEIAKLLYISENTVKKHLQNLYRKFDTKNRTELLYKLKKN